VRFIRCQYRALALCGALSLIGCPSPRIQTALDQRIHQVTTDVAPPETSDAFQVGIAAMIPAVEERVRDQLSALGGTVLKEISAVDVPGTEGIKVALQWEELITEIRPAPGLGPSSLYLLVAVPGTVKADAGVLAVENDLRLTARLPLTLEASVIDGSGLRLGVRLSSVDELLVAVSLRGVPPGMDSALSAAIQTAVREQVRQSPQETLDLLRNDDLLPDLADVPLGSVSVRVFPAGRPTVFIGLQTSLPVETDPAVAPSELLPGESDWIARVDEAVVAAALARAGLSGKLRTVRPPDRLEVTRLHMTDEGFGAEMVLWRLRPPAGRYELEATGDIEWCEEVVRLTVHTLERKDGEPVPGPKRPWTYETPAPSTPWTIDDLFTTDGALVIRGRLP